MEGKPLSGREKDVLRCASRGMSTKETAAAMFLSHGTIHYYRSNAQKKLRASNITHAVYKALKRGLIT